MTQIANPIYDTVFKYMMNDNKVAKLFLSALLEKEILEIEFLDKELVPEKLDAKVMFMDFRAKIRDENGEIQLIIIELQKAKLPSDIMRFRSYLGEQYSNEDNAIIIKAESGVEQKKALPIFSIYFLGHKLDWSTSPVISVKRNYFDHHSGEIITKKEEFIESLTHDSLVIQIPYLKEKRRDDIEKLLMIFDQSFIDTDDSDNRNHILNLKEEDYPEKYHSIIRLLKKLVVSKNIRKAMKAEDRILYDFYNQDKVIAEQKQQIEQRDHTILINAKKFKELGLSVDEIIDLTGLNENEIENL